jgi:hypothetical protein
MFNTERQRRLVALAVLAMTTTMTAACSRRMDMYDQPRYEVYEASAQYADGRASREFPAGTVARGQLRDDDHFYKGMEDTAFARTYPMPVTREVLRRGQERFTIFCTPCHDAGGHGKGMVVRRGFKQPTSLHIERLQLAAPGYFFDVMTNGFGQMPSYAAQVPVADRWAIAAYVRALQLSQNARLADLPADERLRFEAALRQGGRPAPGTGGDTHGGGAHGGTPPDGGGH